MRHHNVLQLYVDLYCRWWSSVGPICESVFHETLWVSYAFLPATTSSTTQSQVKVKATVTFRRVNLIGRGRICALLGGSAAWVQGKAVSPCYLNECEKEGESCFSSDVHAFFSFKEHKLLLSPLTESRSRILYLTAIFACFCCHVRTSCRALTHICSTSQVRQYRALCIYGALYNLYLPPDTRFKTCKKSSHRCDQ